MPTPITICEVPDEVREELAARAALSGRSLEEYVRAELIALAQRPSAAVWMARVRARKDALQHPLPDPRRAAEDYAAERYAAEEEDAAERRAGEGHAPETRELESGVDHGISSCRDVG
jgi:antitoxin FitA